MKQIGTYLILVGLVIFVLVFFKEVLAFIFSKPLLGLALILVIAGVILLLYSIVRDYRRDREQESFRGIEK